MNDNRAWTTREMLEYTLANLDEMEAQGFTKAVVVFLDDKPASELGGDSVFRLAWRNAGIRMSKLLAVAEILKVDAMKCMGYIEDDLE